MGDFVRLKRSKPAIIDSEYGGLCPPFLGYVDEDGDHRLATTPRFAGVTPRTLRRPGKVQHADHNSVVATAHACENRAAERFGARDTRPRDGDRRVLVFQFVPGGVDS